jgi:uncharacterized membrane protein
MAFNFSIRTALKQSWQSFARHPLFFGGLAFVMIIFNLFTSQHHENPVLLAIVIIAAILWSYVWISVSLAAADGKEALLNYKSLSVHMPTVRQFFMIVIIGIIVAIIVGVGFILLIIPGIYFMTRLLFANISFVDKQGSIKKSLEHSWHLVRGSIFWTVFLVLIIEIVLIVIGLLTLTIGLLITYPLALLLVTRLYRALDIYHRKTLQESQVSAV